MRIASLLCYTVLLLGLTACGTGGTVALSTAVRFSPSPIGAPTLPASLPGLPVDELLNPLRMTAAVDAGQTGDAFNRKSANATVAGNTLVLASAPQTVSWGLYLFGGVPGEKISELQLSCGDFAAGEKLYVALGDYATGRWSYLPPVTSAAGSFTLPAGGPSPLQSPLGNTWILFATFGGDSVSVDDVRLTYPDRHSVTGVVTDQFGSGLPGVKVASSFAGLSTVTAADGGYTLPGVPDGTWPILCTLDGWAFYTQPSYVTLAGADAVAPNIIGNPHGSRFDDYDRQPGNDNIDTAPFFDLEAGPLSESVSGDDDPRDAYRFTVNAPGSYLLQFSNPDRDILLPGFSVLDAQDNYVAFGASVLRGEVALVLTVNEAPQDYLVDLYTLAGGGKYTVTLGTTGAGRLLIDQVDGASLLGGGLVGVEYLSTGNVTDYLVNSYVPGSPGYVVYDPAYPAGDVEITPLQDGYTYMPATATKTVAAGTTASQSFAATPPAVADSFEPNDHTGIAHALALPYFSMAGPDALQLSGVSGGDNIDCFSCMPAAGTALTVQVLDPSISRTQQRYELTIYSDTFEIISVLAVDDGGLIALPAALCNGNIVYIIVGVPPAERKNQRQSYRLIVNVMANPVKFQAAARVAGGDLLDGARFLVFSEVFTRLSPNALISGLDGLTAPVYLSSGTRLRVECYRDGTTHERQTQLYELPPSDSILYFDAPDLGLDALEPNGDISLPLVQQALPFHVEATLNATSDFVDCYKLAAGDGQPFKVALTESGGVKLNLEVYDSAGNSVAGRIVGPGETLWAPNDGNAGQFVRVTSAGAFSARYTLDVSTGPAFTISGVVTDTGAVGLDARVTELGSLDYAYAYNFGGGAYELGSLYPPGDYTLAAFAPNYDPDPNTRTVTITNSDVTVDFTDFSAMNHDAFEPNDDVASATMVALATDYASAVGGMDFGDYYTIALLAGDRVRIKAEPVSSWQVVSLGMLDAYTSLGLSGVRQPDGSVVLDYTVPLNDNYVFYVNGGAHYTLRVDKFN